MASKTIPLWCDRPSLAYLLALLDAVPEPERGGRWWNWRQQVERAGVEGKD